MSVRAVLDGVKTFFFRKKAGAGARTGLLYGVLVFLIAALLMLQGMLNNLDTFFNALVFQTGFKKVRKKSGSIRICFPFSLSWATADRGATFRNKAKQH